MIPLWVQWHRFGRNVTTFWSQSDRFRIIATSGTSLVAMPPLLVVMQRHLVVMIPRLVALRPEENSLGRNDTPLGRNGYWSQWLLVVMATGRNEWS